MGGQTSHGFDTQKDGCQVPKVHVHRLLHRWGFSPKVPQKRFVNTASREEKEAFKKVQETLKQIPEGLTIAVQDESIFVHDVLARRKLWLPKGVRPVATNNWITSKDMRVWYTHYGRQTVVSAV